MEKNSAFKDVYQQVTDLVIAELEKGTVIWQQGWNRHGKPRNIVSGQPYRGWNVFWLNALTQAKGFQTPFFITYLQAQQAGGFVKRGEKGFPVVYWALIKQREPETPLASGISPVDEPALRQFRVPKQHIVFNLDQTEGIAIPEAPPVLDESQRILLCENVVSGMPGCPSINHKPGNAYYRPATDKVFMPPFSRFRGPEEYYSTLFHELAHSTGHPSRLNRPELVKSDGYGGKLYAREELTAELAAAYLCGVCGITQTIPNSAAYLDSWITHLKGDKTLLLKAASRAQAAADYILNLPDDAQSTSAAPDEEVKAVRA